MVKINEKEARHVITEGSRLWIEALSTWTIIVMFGLEPRSVRG